MNICKRPKKVCWPILIMLAPFYMSCEKEEVAAPSVDPEVTLEQLDALDKGGRWLVTGIEEANALNSISQTEKDLIAEYLNDLALQPELRCDDTAHGAFVQNLQDQAYPEDALEVVERAHTRVCSILNYHEGYWVQEISDPSFPSPLESINDVHIDAATGSVTVYAQLRLLNGPVQVPAQVNPGEYAINMNGDSVAFHPNSVYLNGSGQELAIADGTGQWWVKHAWVLDGEGYTNWPLIPAQVYGEGLWATGTLLDDGLTIQVGDLDNSHTGEFNLRKPLLDQAPITYEIRNNNLNSDSTTNLANFTCREIISPLDSLARACPQLPGESSSN